VSPEWWDLSEAPDAGSAKSFARELVGALRVALFGDEVAELNEAVA
jgi:hypothetical protein